jgi:hypothetical protein
MAAGHLCLEKCPVEECDVPDELSLDLDPQPIEGVEPGE